MRLIIAVLGILLSWTALAKTATAIFAGGCFWCMQPPFDHLLGVLNTQAGYTGGRTQNPSYKDVSYGMTGHYEAVKVTYDDSKISYQQLLDVYWRNIDPTDAGGQFCDRGNSYRSAIFYQDEQQMQVAQHSKTQLIESGKIAKVVTPIIEAGVFYPAEEYHQNYYLKNPVRYRTYRYLCGRDSRLDSLWSRNKAQ